MPLTQGDNCSLLDNGRLLEPIAIDTPEQVLGQVHRIERGHRACSIMGVTFCPKCCDTSLTPGVMNRKKNEERGRGREKKERSTYSLEGE